MKCKRARYQTNPSVNISRDSPPPSFYKYHHRNLSGLSKELLLNTGNFYANKCHQLWSNFNQPTKPMLIKYPIDTEKLKLKNPRTIGKKTIKNTKNTKKTSKISNSNNIIKTNLPPIKKIVVDIDDSAIYRTWQVDSDDEDEIFHLNRY